MSSTACGLLSREPESTTSGRISTSEPWSRHALIADDARLLAAAIEGKDWVWSEIVERYGALVMSVTSSFGLDNADAADVRQEVWTLLFKNMKRIRHPERIAGWIKTVARNESLRVCIRDRYETPRDTGPDLPGNVDDDVDGRILENQRQVALRQALADLPDRARVLLEAQLDQPELTYRELSIKLDMPIGSIGPTRQRCVSKLRTAPELARLRCS